MPVIRSVSLTTLTLSTWLLLPVSLDGQDWTKQVRRLSGAVARLTTESTVCTAIRVAPRRFLSASHCLEPGDVIRVGGRLATVQAVAVGLALLVVKADWSRVALSLRDDAPPGLPVMVAGYGLDRGRKHMFGWVIDDRDTYPNVGIPALWINVTVLPGMSGGPVVDHRGRLAGVIDQMLVIGNPRDGSAVPVNIAIAIPVATIQRFLLDHGVLMPPPGPRNEQDRCEPSILDDRPRRFSQPPC